MKRASITTYDILVGNFNKSLQNDTVEVRVFIAQFTHAFLYVVLYVLHTEWDDLREQSIRLNPWAE